MSRFQGTARLTRLALRRDRVSIPAWAVGLAAFVAFTTALFVDSLAVHDDLVRETRLVTTNAGMRLLGLTSGASVGGYLLHREFVTMAVLVSLMCVFTVVRHTRQNEELGRAELLGAAAIGRFAPLSAAVVVAVAADVVVSTALGAAMAIGGLPAADSFLAGASIGLVGLCFVGVAAVACQLVSTTRAASGLSAAALALAFLTSGVGNMAGDVDGAGLRTASAWPAWLSPMGWGQQVRPFGEAVVWPLGLGVVALAALLGLAFWLAERRDTGRGMWSERPGAVHAAASLLSPAGLAWRLQRNVLAAWVVGMALFGLIFGSMSEQIREGDFDASDWAPPTGGVDAVLDGFLTSMVQIGGMFVAVYAVQVLLRMRTDESGGTLEPLLATAVTRTGWVAGHVVNAVAGSVVLLLVYGLGMGLTADLVLGGSGARLRELTLGSLLQLPGVLVTAAVVVAAVGLVPRWAAAVSWSFLIVAWVLGPMFGPALDLPTWAQDLSPFSHVAVPASDPTLAAPLVLVALALGTGCAGLVALRRRTLLLPA